MSIAMPSDAIPADSAVFPAIDALVPEPLVRPMPGLPRALVWAVLVLAPWVAIVQIVRLVF